MAEYLTLFDEAGRDTGFVQLRDGSVRAGACYLVVSIFTQDEAGCFLVTRRSPQKPYYPLCWEVTGGCVCAGEKSRAGAARELREETGLTPQTLAFRGRVLTPTLAGGAFFLLDVYSVRVKGRAPAVRMQADEVCEAQWVTRQQLTEMLTSLPMEPLTPLAWRIFQSGGEAEKTPAGRESTPQPPAQKRRIDDQTICQQQEAAK